MDGTVLAVAQSGQTTRARGAGGVSEGGDLVTFLSGQSHRDGGAFPWSRTVFRARAADETN